MRILTWNVNVLRTCLDYHPFSSMKKKNVEGLLDELGAEIFCFQEHKTRRNTLEKSMACPGPYDGFWTFPRKGTGYAGVCTYVDSRYCVPIKAEEGITGLLLDDKASTMRPPWTPEERIGSYPEVEEMNWLDEEGAGPFDVKRLDMEGRAVVTDFGLFILFNLYSPNETNDTRRPYKMNFLQALQERVRLLVAAGREVIIAGDLNIIRAPIDSGEGGIRSSAEQHYEHPARVIFNDWIAPRGPMIDVVRESFPQRDDMFTCWNQKLDARPSNYGSRIDYILCSPGLRPWIKGGDILNKVYGSDHCPVYIDLHETIDHPTLGHVNLRDVLNPPDRALSTAPTYPNAQPRVAPEPPRFATKFLDEFSGRQTSLKSFFGGGKKVDRREEKGAGAGPGTKAETTLTPQVDAPPAAAAAAKAPIPAEEVVPAPFALARAAFDSLDVPDGNAAASGSKRRKSTTAAIDMTGEDDWDVGPAFSASTSTIRPALAPKKSSKSEPAKPKSSSAKPSKSTTPSQSSISSFFAPPSKQRSMATSSPPLRSTKEPSVPSTSQPRTSQSPSIASSSRASCPSEFQPHPDPDPEEDAAIAAAIYAADTERSSQREAKKAEAAPIWNNLFAKKVPPLCVVHGKPCKDFIVKIPGPNKGKRFWLCSLPVGAGYDNGRTKRKREEVNPEFRCDFFLWDSANSKKEIPSAQPSTKGVAH